MDNENIGLQDAAPVTNAEEKMLSQSEVNRIVGAAKAEAAERARRQAAEQFQAESAKTSSPPSMGGIPQQGMEDQIKARVQEELRIEREREAQERQQQADAEYKAELRGIADTFVENVRKGKAAYEDFDTVTADFDIRAFPQLVFLSAGLDNVADVVYELSKNPQKLMTIQGLAERSPKMAQSQLQALSNSIKQNQQALENPNNTNPPLPRLKPSTTAGADAGARTIRDLRKEHWLKG